MKKIILALSVLAGLLYGLKVGPYLTDYSWLLIVLFIVIVPTILSFIGAKFLNERKTLGFYNSLLRLVGTFFISALLIFITVFSTQFIAYRNHSDQMYKEAKLMIKKIEDYRIQNKELPNNLSLVRKSESDYTFIYSINEDEQKYTLAFISSTNLFNSNSIKFYVYNSLNKSWFKTSDVKKIGY
ncbi:MAG: hypothetical protein HWD82_11050 [Flavobacteriaceae bacterium]|nr:hypothetical protein [Flavobacteriaceae bacterium]